MDLKKLRDDRTLAHVVPLVAFMAVGGVLLLVTDASGFFREHEYLPWWRSHPEHWIYPLQALVGGVLVAFWWRQYDLRWSTPKVLIGAVMGAVGIGLWILPTQLYDWMGLEEEPEGWLKRLGVVPREDGFDPGIFESPAAWWTAVILRFIRAAVVVAFVEEFMWRGFAMRYVIDQDRTWQVPFGQPSWRSYLIVTALVVLVHQPVDYAGAFVWGTLVYGVAVWTRSLLACVVMHGVANFLMGWYALAFGKYGLW